MKDYAVLAIILIAGTSFFGGLSAMIHAKHPNAGEPIVMEYGGTPLESTDHNPGRGLDPVSNAQELHVEGIQHPCEAVYDAPNGDLQLCWGEVTEGTAGTTYSDPRPIEGQAPPADLMRSHE